MDLLSEFDKVRYSLRDAQAGDALLALNRIERALAQAWRTVAKYEDPQGSVRRSRRDRAAFAALPIAASLDYAGPTICAAEAILIADALLAELDAFEGE